MTFISVTKEKKSVLRKLGRQPLCVNCRFSGFYLTFCQFLDMYYGIAIRLVLNLDLLSCLNRLNIVSQSQVCYESGATQQWTSLHRNALPASDRTSKTQRWSRGRCLSSIPQLIDSFPNSVRYLILALPQDPVPLPLLHASGSTTFEGIKLRFLVIDRLGR